MNEFKATHLAPIKLGHTGENEAVRVTFSLVPFKEEFPGGRPALLVKPPKGGNAYPVALTSEGDTAYWTITAADTAVAGFGQCELQWYAGDTLAKSDKFDFWVVQALEAGAEPPDEPSKRWFDAIQAQIGNLADLTTEEKKNLVAAINEAARSGGGSGGGYNIGPGLKLDAETNTLSVDTAESVEKDNTKPVTSAAVYTEVGNINALLATI